MRHLIPIRDGFYYDPDTGEPWSVRVRGVKPINPLPERLKMFRLHKMHAKTKGYYRVGIGGKVVQWHRLVWEHFNGPIPEGMQVDHINHNRGDNRLENLRLVDAITNSRCHKPNHRNTSGYPGVSWHNMGCAWAAKIRVDNKAKHLGLFDDPEEAYRAYYEAKVLFHGVDSIRALPRPQDRVAT